jgi:hypothetical protein
VRANFGFDVSWKTHSLFVDESLAEIHHEFPCEAMTRQVLGNAKLSPTVENFLILFIRSFISCYTHDASCTICTAS